MQICQRQLMQELTSVIQTQLATMQLGSNTRSNAGTRPIEHRDLSAPANRPPSNSYGATGNDNSQQASGVSNRSLVSVHQDKVPTIIQSWRIKFDGVRDWLQTEEFLYRIRALAQQNLNADQNILRDHLHLFFGGKATEWYWKFHKANPNFTWS